MKGSEDSDRQRRLLDLLSGWIDSLQRCADVGDFPGVTKEEYKKEAEQVAILYQKVGSEEPFTHESYEMAMREIGNIVRTGGVS